MQCSTIIDEIKNLARNIDSLKKDLTKYEGSDDFESKLKYYSSDDA